MQRRNFLFAMAAPALAQRSRRPNVLVLFSDDQRFDTIHALNNPAIQTPNLDRLCARGTAFTQATIMGGNQPAVCVPSRAMLMTGQTLYHAVKAFAGERPFVMFPPRFAAQGYSTFGAGKWHNGPKLYQQAFQSGGPVMFGGMNDHYRTPVHAFNPFGEYPAGAVTRSETHSSELFTNGLLGFLKARDKSKPFCAYLAFTAPHDPRQAPPEWLAKYPPDKIQLPPNFLPQHPFDNGELQVRDEMLIQHPRTPEAVKKEIADYYAIISHMDQQIGRILDVLDQAGLTENTLLVFAGDNGLAVGQHGLVGKQSLYEHSIRVPLIVAGPGVKRGGRSDALVSTHDIFPTLCEAAGVPKPATVEGTSFLPALQGSRFAGRPDTFHAYRDFMRAVRTPTHKLILTMVKGKTTRQLFDLKQDPWEMHNLAGDPAQTGRVAEMEALLRKRQRQMDDPLA